MLWALAEVGLANWIRGAVRAFECDMGADPRRECTPQSRVVQAWRLAACLLLVPWFLASGVVWRLSAVC